MKLTAMKTIMLRLTNDFHNTETRIRARRVGDYYRVTMRVWDRACDRLCGMGECQCGSIRGPITDKTGRRYHAEQWDNVSVVLEAC